MRKSIRKSHNGKSPGLDGLLVELYKAIVAFDEVKNPFNDKLINFDIAFDLEPYREDSRDKEVRAKSRLVEYLVNVYN